MTKIVFIDLDDTLCAYSLAHRAALERRPEVPYPQSLPGFFAGLEPISGAIEAVEALLASPCYDPYILTAPSVLNPLCYTEKRLWVEQHLGLDMTRKLIIALDKSLLRGDLLVDDFAEGRGQESFEGRLIHFGSANFPDWKAVRSELGI